MKDFYIEDALTFSPPEDEQLAAIYETFLDLSASAGVTPHHQSDGFVYYSSLEDLKKKPTSSWYKKLDKLITDCGHEKYRNFVKYILEKTIHFQSGHNTIARLKKSGTVNYNNQSEYYKKLGIEHFRTEAPNEYYFYCSDKARYLRGLILSVSCIPDPTLLNLLERFASIYPFQSAPASQAPTGLFTYDTFTVFEKLPVTDAVRYLMGLKPKIRGKYGQKKIDSILKNLAKKHQCTVDDFLEIALPDFGFDDHQRTRMTVGDYNMVIDIPEIGCDKVYWINTSTDKQQKSVPKDLKIDHKERLTYLKKWHKDIISQLSINAKRLESYYLTDKTWPYETWEDHYLRHNFKLIITKSLIWLFHIQGQWVPGIIEDRQVRLFDSSSPAYAADLVKLWHPTHPIAPSIEALFENKTQAFKQVGREKYDYNYINEQRESIPLNKSVLSQLYKSRGWSFLFPHIKLAIVPLNLVIKAELVDINDGTRGQFSGSGTTRIGKVTAFRENQEISLTELSTVVYSELARDLDLFTAKAAR